MNYSRFINAVSVARKQSPLRQITEVLSKSPPSMISMATGMPNGELFPFKDITYTLRDGSSLQLGEVATRHALQYCPTQGISELVSWLMTLQDMVHSPPTLSHPPDSPSRMCLCVTSGSQDGICKAVESLVQKGDNILIESPVYSGTLAALRPLGCNLIPVTCDADGIQPANLAEILRRWQPHSGDPSIPKFLYTVPNGGNPTGHGLTLSRKQEIYDIARSYNLLILEDDPYFFLQFNEPYIPSFLSLDTDGRVLRFDSCSKLLSSGMRIGYVTGPYLLIERIMLHMQASVLQANSLAQITLISLLKNWGHEGLLSHAARVRDFYRVRRDQCLKAASTHLTGLAEWSAPRGGMFLWLRLLGISDTHQLIMQKARAKQVMFVPGSAFSLNVDEPSSHVRASYSIATEQQMDEGFRRLAELIREELQEK